MNKVVDQVAREVVKTFRRPIVDGPHELRRRALRVQADAILLPLGIRARRRISIQLKTEAEIGDEVLRDLDGDGETRHRLAVAGEKIVGTAFEAAARSRNIPRIRTEISRRRQRRLLRAGGERPCHHRIAEPGNNLPPSDAARHLPRSPTGSNLLQCSRISRAKMQVCPPGRTQQPRARQRQPRRRRSQPCGRCRSWQQYRRNPPCLKQVFGWLDAFEPAMRPAAYSAGPVTPGSLKSCRARSRSEG